MVKERKLDVIIVCVNHSHFLRHTLEHNSLIFENITVVTHSKDKLTIQICRLMGVNIVFDDMCLKEKFNKSMAINSGINSLKKPDFILLLDADIIVKDKINVDKINENSLYTSGRYIVSNPMDYVMSDYDNIKEISSFESDRGLDFFQLFNYNMVKKYPDNNLNDLTFKKSFYDVKNIGSNVVHLGTPNRRIVNINYKEVEEITSKKNPKVLVIMAAYNAEDTIRGSIESVLSQYHENFIFSIIDDCSNDKTYDIIKEYEKKDKRIKAYRNTINKGAYYSRNIGLYNHIDEVDFWTIHDADDKMMPNRLSKMLEYKETHLAISCYLKRVNGYTNELVETNISGDHSNVLFNKKVFEKLGYYDNSTRFAGDSEYSARFKIAFGYKKRFVIKEFLFIAYNYNNNETVVNPIGSQKRISYVNRYREKHKKMSSNFFMEFNKDIKEKKFIGIASIPSRVKTLEKTIHSLLKQVDSIGVYLNGWDYIPEYLNNDKITIVRSQDNGDYGDAGKFYWIDNYEGYYFSCDDDIIYPDDYIEKTIKKIEENRRRAVIGFHGTIIKDDFKDYYSIHSRKVCHFNEYIEKDTTVHIIGTGTLGFHTSTIEVKFKDFITPNMADIYFARLGQNQKVKFIIQKHNSNVMYSLEDNSSISKSGINKDNSNYDTSNLQNEIIKSIDWKLY